ncbi:nucleic acid-binding protein [Ascobolus immersus RN42]|uniref:rRNA biogenesis protein RRP5 n=1 Tax=Ascobolus immersus RN42 TaxID=1160509 RepID=A0A3N4IDR0_ASCIM|nr:nucleic acid-binding protein [Ascobolus immersus RN42]
MAGTKNDRKRPAESIKPTGDSSKRLKKADAPKKDAKKDAKKPASSSKPTSTPVESAPTPVVKSTLKAKEETAFPRGGKIGSGLTPLEYKEITNQATKDVLFEAKTGKAVEDTEETKSKGKKVFTKEKKSKKGKSSKEAEKEDDGPKVEGLSFKRLAPGSLVLGCISAINQTDIALSLPNNLTGYVPLTSISDKYNEKLQKMLDGSESDDEDKENEEPEDDKEDEGLNLESHFKVGQYLRAYVESTMEEKSGAGKAKKHIVLSIHPSKANSGITKRELVNGCTLQASVKSVEDHGLIMDLGLGPDFASGFLGKKDLGEEYDLNTIEEGAVILCAILGMSGNEKIVKLTTRFGGAPPAKKTKGANKGTWVELAPTIDAFLPGTGVEVLVTDLKNGGFTGKIMGSLDATADYFQACGWESKPLEDRVKTGSKIKARIISTYPNSDPKKVGISILPHVLALSPPSKDLTTIPISSTLKEAKVLNVEPKSGLFMDSGIPHVPGYVHISRISSDEKIDSLSATSGEFKIGSQHAARVIGYSFMDGLFLMSTEKKILEQKYLNFEDVKIGEVVKGKIERLVAAGGVIVQISEGISGFVEELHMSDVALKNPEKKFREGVEVKCRVLSKDPSKKQIRLTMKKTLVNYDGPIIDSYEKAQVGQQVIGTMIKVMANGAVVKFYGNVKAYLPVHEMSEAYIKDPREHFKVGQSISVFIADVDPSAERMRVSCKKAEDYDEAQKQALNDLKPGTLVTGTVIEKSAEDLMVQVEAEGITGLKGLLTFGQLAEGGTTKGASAFKRFRAGQKIKDMVVLIKNTSRRIVTLSLKPSLVAAAKEGKLPGDFSDLKIGTEYSGFVTNIIPTGVFVSFAGGVSGLVPKRNIPEEMTSKPLFGLEKFQGIKATVKSIDETEHKFILSLIKGDTAKASGSKLSQELSNPVDKTLTTWDDISAGRITSCRVISVMETQVNVELADKVQGRIDISCCFDEYKDIPDKKRPLKKFNKGDIITVKVIGTHDARNHTFLPISHRTARKGATVFDLTAKESELVKGEPDVLDIKSIKVGQELIGFVNNYSPDGVWVSLSPALRGFIRKLNLTDNVNHLADLKRNFPLGFALKCKVLTVDTDKVRVDLTARGDEKEVDWTNIKKGMVLPGRVTKVTDRQVYVQISEAISGVIELTNIADNYNEVKLSKFDRGQIIRVCVIDLDVNNKRVTLSMRPSRVMDNKAKVEDPEIQTIAQVQVGDVRRGFIRNVSDKGVFVALGGNVVAFVRVSDLSDQFIKEWKQAYRVDQLVRGKITAVESALGHVQMSLKHSVIEGALKPELTLNNLKKGMEVDGYVKAIAEFGVFIALDGSNVSGLCHRSEISDDRNVDFKALYTVGDLVKAKVLNVDVEKRKVSLGLKQSYFKTQAKKATKDEEEADSDDEEMRDVAEDSDDEAMSSDAEEGGVRLNVKDADDSDASESENEDDDEEMTDAPLPTGPALSTSGFDWTLSALDDTQANDDDSDAGEIQERKKKKRKATIVVDHTADFDAREAQSVSDFERTILANPQSSYHWIKYMTFHLQLSEVEKAREVGERALKHILSSTPEGAQEKENVWVAMLNLENEFGDEESLEELFKRACQYNDDMVMYEKLSNIYVVSGKFEKADELLKAMTKKHSTHPRPYLLHAQLLFSPPPPHPSNPSAARAILPRALQAIPKVPESTHTMVISKFAQLEFRYADAERGRTIFEGLLSKYPKKSDIATVWIDSEIKFAKEHEGENEDSKKRVRALFKRLLEPGQCKFQNRGAMGLFKKWGKWEETTGGNSGEMEERAARFVAVRKAEKEDKEEE